MSGEATNAGPGMSKSASNQEKMQQLLMAVATGPLEDTTGLNATEYNWNEPHYLNREQLNTLDDFTKRTGKKIAQKFGNLCNNDFDVSINSVTQHFAMQLMDQALDSNQNDYYVAFGVGQDNPCGFISIPLKTAFVWATQLLGDTEAEENPDRDFSQLEESLLLDVATTIIEAISESNNVCDFVPGKTIVRRLLPLELQGTEELCRITFTLKRVDAEDNDNLGEAHLVMLSNKLEPIVGKTQAVEEFSAEDISKTVLSHLYQTSVSITARLAQTSLAFEQIMDLREGDVLMLDKNIDEPVELIVEGETMFCGQPAQSGGKYAVQVTKTVEHASTGSETA
jgi:flagellar motor switch protein FliM